MKSSTLNPSNIQALRADKRFEALVKQEMQEHQAIISSHHKEMQALRGALHLSMERFESLFEKNEQDLRDFKKDTDHQIHHLKHNMSAGELTISEQKKTIESLYGQLLVFYEIYASKIDVEKLKKEVNEKIKEVTTSHINSFMECQREFKILFLSLKDDLMKLRSEIQKKLEDLIDKVENNFSISRLDKEGVLRELHVYEKTVFIIEKKIENIYTLIERINIRGDVCHRPV